MIKISKRLELIANLVENNTKIIDIGCDHGLLDIYLSQKLNNVKIIASDINKNALNNAIKNIQKYNINNIETRLGNGLDVVDKNEINTIVIAGMGTYTIIDILSSNINKLDNVNSIIIQSNNNIDKLREYIVSIGYYIDDELLVEENNIIYTIIKFKKGLKKYTKKELFLGPILLEKKDDLFYKLCDINKNKLTTILNNIPDDKIEYKKDIKEKIVFLK